MLALMFHSSFTASAFAAQNDRLLTFVVTLQRLKFPTNESVHICIGLLVSACRWQHLPLAIGFQVYCGLQVAVNPVATDRADIRPV